MPRRLAGLHHGGHWVKTQLCTTAQQTRIHNTPAKRADSRSTAAQFPCRAPPCDAICSIYFTQLDNYAPGTHGYTDFYWVFSEPSQLVFNALSRFVETIRRRCDDRRVDNQNQIKNIYSTGDLNLAFLTRWTNTDFSYSFQ